MAPKPRRVHTKSRYGCDHCKHRRVKCDERKPSCTNCSTRDLECHYSRPARPSASGPQMDSSSNAQSPASFGSTSPSAGFSTDPLGFGPYAYQGDSLNLPFRTSTRQRELELMHYWFTKTSSSFTTDHTDLFRGHAVEEALKHEHLADSIFALASLHIASETIDPVSAAAYVSVALRYQNNAVSSFRSALQSVTQSNCDALFFSSVLIVACAMVSPLLPAGAHDAVRSPLESMLLSYDFLNGVRSVIDISRQWLESGPCRDIFMARRRLQTPVADEFKGPFQRLQKLNNTCIGPANPLYETYQHAIQQLERCFLEGRTSAVVAWLVQAGKDFVTALQKGERMALMIFMYWGVLLDRSDEMWWAKYSGKRIVEELFGNFDGYGNDWEEATKWASVQVGL
ncbi:hypothetical protein BKA64DRAFT_410668 [Cadophora sp. MPI-SDFR-AT-0126]|nr:hypothetical protein BKA64DRAFT_410668 [Leotiomycetes sp. MPI-SDFR-AT-0126]